MFRIRNVFLVFACSVAIAGQANLPTFKNTDQPQTSPWVNNYSCGGLMAQLWTQQKGWHKADCSEIANKLSELRDARNIMVSTGPSVPDMLAYAQYETYFRISTEDFAKSAEICRRLLQDNIATQGILRQCRETVKGVVPYQLKLKG